MAIYTALSLRALPKPSVLVLLYRIQKVLANLKDKNKYSTKGVKMINRDGHVYNFSFCLGLVGLGVLLFHNFLELLFVPILGSFFLVHFANVAIQAPLFRFPFNFQIVRELAAIPLTTGT